MAGLGKEHLAVLSSEVSDEEIRHALSELMLDNVDDLASYEEFLRALQDCNGDLTEIVGKTHEPVSIEQFIEDDYFLGLPIIDDEDEDTHKAGLWRGVFDACKEIANGSYVEALFMGAIGIGKTTAAQILTLYNIYLLSCERWPQLRYSLMPMSDLVFVCLNVTDTLACDVTYGQLRNLIEDVPYFREQYPFDPSLKRSLAFPNHVYVKYGAAYAKKFMGQNVVGGIVDELNFMSIVENSKKHTHGGEFNQAVEVYHSLVRRLKSRLTDIGRLPGCICLVSSKGYPDDFTEQRKREALAENDGSTFVFDKAQWEVRPLRSFKDGPKFRVELGNSRYSSRILSPSDTPREGAEVLHVPMFFLKDFKRDLLGALRDFGGRTTDVNAAYFYDRDLIWSMADYWDELGYATPFDREEVDFTFGIPNVVDGYVVPNPDRPRSCHIDLGLSRDSCGIAVGHVFKVDMHRVFDRESEEYVVEEFPHIAYDAVLTVRPPQGGQIEFAEVRQLVYYMRDMVGLPIRWVTYDGFESVDSRQILRHHGFKTDRISVEALEVYSDMRTAMYFHKRLAAPEHSIAFAEFARLEPDYDKDKIDHPPKGSKDTCDAMTGVFRNLGQQRSSWSSTLRESDAPSEASIVAAAARKLNRERRSFVRPRSARPR